MRHRLLLLHCFFASCVIKKCLTVKVDPELSGYLFSAVSRANGYVQPLQLNGYLHIDLIGTGFHRAFSVAIVVQADTAIGPSPLIVLVNITKDMYVDVDQLNALQQIGELNSEMTVSGQVDTELPASMATNYWILYCDRVNKTVQLPLHFRYQPSSRVPYRMVVVPLPQVLFQCSTSNMSKSPLLRCKGPVLQLPCAMEPHLQCSWMTVSLGSETHLQVDIPSGLIHHTVMVMLVTATVTFLGTVYLIIVITK